jgi:hypothetical protein
MSASVYEKISDKIKEKIINQYSDLIAAMYKGNFETFLNNEYNDNVRKTLITHCSPLLDSNDLKKNYYSKKTQTNGLLS